MNGFYDFGPMGCAMKANLLQAWRNFFVLEENLLEVDTAMLTPEVVLKYVWQHINTSLIVISMSFSLFIRTADYFRLRARKRCFLNERLARFCHEQVLLVRQ